MSALPRIRASTRPDAAPSRTSGMLSPRSCRINRPLVAPSDRRTANSRVRVLPANHEIGQVRAGDEQHKACETKQHPQWRLVFTQPGDTAGRRICDELEVKVVFDVLEGIVLTKARCKGSGRKRFEAGIRRR